MVIEAMPRIIKEIPQVHLVIIGTGVRKSILERLVNKKRVGEYVTLKGWIEFRYVPQYLRVAKAGIIPHLSTEHTNTTIPNKIFDYMAHGLPVIASDVAPMKTIIEEEKCGVTFEANNLDDFVNAVVRVYHDRENNFGKNGKDAVYKRYNWKEDSAVLLKVFDDLQTMSG
jgi:glycosyltransferase involved in cell wall biosynthesis